MVNLDERLLDNDLDFVEIYVVNSDIHINRGNNLGPHREDRLDINIMAEGF
jgi:hypothetical protein